MPLNNKSIAIFDISSGSVGGSIVSFPKKSDQKPEVIFSIRNNIDLVGRSEFNKFFDATLKTLEKTAMQVHEHGEVVLSDIYCFFTSPWATLHRNELEYDSREDFIVNDKLIQKLIDKNYPKTDSDPQFFEHSDMSTIERNIVSLELNGYRRNDYVGEKAKSIKINILDFLISNNIKEFFEEKIENVFLRTPKIKSSILAINIATEAINPEIDNSIVIDIGGEITEIAVVTGDNINRILSIPFGENNFHRIIDEKLNCGIDEARRIFRMYFGNMLEQKRATKIESFLNLEKDRFLKNLLDGFGTLSNLGRLPSDIFISTNTEMQEWISNGILELEPNNFVKGKTSVNTIPLDIKLVDDYVDFRDKDLADSAIGLQVISILGEIR